MQMHLDMLRCHLFIKSDMPSVPVKSLKHPPPLGIPWVFDVFSCPRGREFDELSLPGAGHLITTLYLLLITTHRGWEI